MIGSGFMTAALLAGCTAESGARLDSARVDTTSRAIDSQGASGVNADANSTPPSADSARASSEKSVTFLGVAPLRIGMSDRDVRRALGMPASDSTSNDECHYLDTKGKSRVYVMLVRDTVARLDVRDSTMTTEAGARIGDAESRIASLYSGRLTMQPHKYVSGGHYLVVNSPADTTRRLVFETDGKRVTSYRVGRMPEVMWVEGCS